MKWQDTKSYNKVKCGIVYADDESTKPMLYAEFNIGGNIITTWSPECDTVDKAADQRPRDDGWQYKTDLEGFQWVDPRVRDYLSQIVDVYVSFSDIVDKASGWLDFGTIPDPEHVTALTSAGFERGRKQLVWRRSYPNGRLSVGFRQPVPPGSKLGGMEWIAVWSPTVGETRAMGSRAFGLDTWISWGPTVTAAPAASADNRPE